MSTDAIRIKAVLQVVDLATGEFLREFPVRWEPGWRFSVCRDEVTCIVGAYECYGVAAYDLRDGQELWRRKDLRAIQVVNAFPKEDLVFCGREAKAAHLLDCRTGQSVRTFRGVTGVWASPYDGTCLVEARKIELHRPLGQKVAALPPLREDTISTAFSPDAVLISERKGALQCIETSSGACRWKYVPHPDRHVELTAFMEAQNVFVAVESRHYDAKPPAKLLHLDVRNGTVMKEIILGSWCTAEFCLNASAIFDPSGMLVCTNTGQLLRTLAFPEWNPH